MLIRPAAHWKEQTPFTFPPGSDHKAARVWEHALVPIRVLRSKARMKNGEGEWIHLSVSRKDRLPSWPDLVKVKNEFLGLQAEAIQVLPKQSDYINLHPNCLHLWSPLSDCRDMPNLQNI